MLINDNISLTCSNVPDSRDIKLFPDPWSSILIAFPLKTLLVNCPWDPLMLDAVS